ncbi:MAG: toll/interleukin-1 receptor domain-containing protein [Nostoc sp.]|uniref:toll/interleukin-1 receptor domain-containing protein n=1 Tax=Nostoc sp. TaxID=1180 RepID=UPI002FF18624
MLPGEEWDYQINDNLNTADIILLLISSDFLFSKYCWDVEVKKAIERHHAGEACVIPVILRSVDWSGAPFAKLQALPKNAEPVVSRRRSSLRRRGMVSSSE